ncbi:MAG TPA: hypothetical protein VHB79_37585 [Polyangiaceae bacterium]|nr:hypothetical protein [Polyangiaceae bacterium]
MSTKRLGFWMGALCAAAVPLLQSANAHAEVLCGYMENDTWNVAEGGMIWNQSAGMIQSAMQAIGEKRTHVAVSNGVKEGTGVWVTHATMRSPSVASWPTVCDDPLDKGQLRFGQPGASQTPIGGYFQYLHGSDGQSVIDYKWQRGNSTLPDTSMNGVTNVIKSWPANSNRGQLVSDFFWWSMPYGVFTGQTNVTGVDTRYFKLKWDNGQYMSYGLKQFRDIESVNLGQGPSTNNGVVCSTLASYGSQRADAGWVKEKVYTHQQVHDGLQALYNDVYAQCKSGTGYWKRVKSAVACFDGDLCNETAQQVLDCFALGNCTDGESEAWAGVRDDPAATARSVSPDCVTGWAPGCGVTGPGASPWAYDFNQDVVFSGAGRRFGCWD